MSEKATLAIADPAKLVYGIAPRPVACGSGVVIGGGTIYPEVNFTLPPGRIDESHIEDIRGEYRKAITEVAARATALHCDGIVVEFEHLPPMTRVPEWGASITRILRDVLDDAQKRHGLKSALRVTPVDIREPGPDGMVNPEDTATLSSSFRLCAEAGADLLAIESVGGKHVTDPALMQCDLREFVRGLTLIGCADAAVLWDDIVRIARGAPRPCVASGDSACGFGNTAMVLAERGYIPRVFAAVVRVVTAVKSMVAFERGAVGPSKDCAYEGIYCKALAGVPIAMEGKSATVAHTSPIGNVAACAADLWSNESVEMGRVLSGSAVVASFESLVYDCRLMNEARRRDGEEGAVRMAAWLAGSDAPLDVQAWVLTPEFAIDAARVIASVETPYLKARAAARFTLNAIREAAESGKVLLPEAEEQWLDNLQEDAGDLPDDPSKL